MTIDETRHGVALKGLPEIAPALLFAEDPIRTSQGENKMSDIPSRCPACNNKKLWKEEVNAFTSGVPAAGGKVRIRLISVRGIFAKPIKEKLGFYKVKYRCKNCGYEQTYDLPR